MDERTFANRIKTAVTPPKAPEALTRRTVQRGIAIRRGLAAEEALARLGSAAPSEKSAHFASLAVVGKMAQNILPPDGVSADAMTKRLEENGDFKRAVHKNADLLLADIRSGELIRSLTGHKPQVEEKIGQEPTKQDDGPVRGL